MAAKVTMNHKRTDSVVDCTDLASETLATAQSFCTAVSFFTSEHGFNAIHELVSLIPQQELEIKSKDETIRDLRAKLVALKEQHDDYNDQQLSNFEGRYDEWKVENTTLQNKIKELNAVSKEKDSKVTALEAQLEKLQSRLGDLEADQAHKTKRMKEKDQQLSVLDAKLQRAQADTDVRGQEIRKAHSQIDALQKSFDIEAKQHRALGEEAEKTQERLKELLGLSVKIKGLNMPEITVRLEKLWSTATNLVGHYFGQDMPDEVLKNDWTRLRDNDVFKHQIPLPQSNTNVAKKMRAAVILGILTRLVDRYIFQPNYLLYPDSGLREILCDQANIHPMKERYARGILLSMFPEDQETNSEDRLQSVAKALLETANVRTMLSLDTFATFSKALDDFTRQCREEWRIVQRGKESLEPSFDCSITTDHPWQLFGGTHVGIQNGEISETTTATENIVVIPRTYLVKTKDELEVITPGSILCKAHIHAASEEIRRNTPSGPFAQAASSRHRRPVRTVSVTGDRNSFLA